MPESRTIAIMSATSYPGNPDTKRLESIRRLGSSTFNYWFGYVANLTLVAWLVSYAWGHGRLQLSHEAFAGLAVGGLLSWTLAEYLLHRYVYHEWASFLSVGHALHHKSPSDLIGVPWYLTTIGLVALFFLIALPLPATKVGPVMGFSWLGYVFYCICHHGSHHWNLKRGWLARMRRHHLIHHGHPEFNWGFTTPLWDLILGTYYLRGKSATARQVETPVNKAQPNG